MSSFLHQLIAFVIVLGVIVTIHELGHLLVARAMGVKVLRFSFGYGKPIWSWTSARGTEWALAPFPLGGYVKLLDEREGPVPEALQDQEFTRKSLGARAAILVAGPFSNFLLAIVILWGVFIHGSDELRAVLAQPAAGTPAAVAGVQEGDRVQTVGDVEVETWQEFRWLLLQEMVKGGNLQLGVLTRQGTYETRRLDFSGLTEAVDGESFERVGFALHRPLLPPVIGTVEPGSVAEAAGFLAGDRILLVDGQNVASWSQVVQSIRSAGERPLAFVADRQGKEVTLTVTPVLAKDGGQSFGRIGVGVQSPERYREEMFVTVAHPPIQALGYALKDTWDKSVFSLVMMGKMVTGAVSWKNLSGPVTIADYAGQSARMGLDYFLKFMAWLSISIGVLNLLPIPLLDGGHLMYYAAEWIRGRPLPERAQAIGQSVGFALLALLMAFAFYNDLNRLISG